MALTPAERAKRYREKLKENPQKYEIQKKKQQERLKKNQKKIAEMTEEEKIKKRRIWRHQKRKQKEKKKENVKEAPPNIKKTTTKLHSFRIKYTKLKNSYQRAMKNIEKLKIIINRVRKQQHRMKIKQELEVSTLKDENAKLKVRQEILEISLRQQYTESKTHKNKQLLRSIYDTQAIKNSNSGKYIAKCLGVQKRTFKPKERLRNAKIEKEITNFFERDDISRCTAGKKECKTKYKEKKQIRYMTDTLRNLHKIYKDGGGKYSFTTFFKYKPFYVLSPTVNNRETCMCVKHSNFQFVFDALKKKSVITEKTIKDLINSVCCEETFRCMYNYCDKCRGSKVEYKKNDCEDNVTWSQWGRANKTYYKSGEELVAKITKKELKTGTINDLISEFETQMPIFKKHYYNYREQQKQYRNCIENLKNDELAILCDFSENFESKLGQEIQSMHFGGSKNTITVHTGMIFGKDKCQSFASVCDDNCHEPHAIWAHLIPVVKFLRENYVGIQVIHFFSDGPSSQYRQKKNFYLLNLFTTKFNLSYTTWSFSESGHGKGIADGIGGATKRALDRHVAYGNDVTNATDAYNHLKTAMKTVQCFYISKSDVSNIKTLVPNNLKAIQGTMQIHQVMTKHGEKQIQYRSLSCFCGEMRGLCCCLSPKLHVFATTSELAHEKLGNIQSDLVCSSNSHTLESTAFDSKTTSLNDLDEILNLSDYEVNIETNNYIERPSDPIIIPLDPMLISSNSNSCEIHATDINDETTKMKNDKHENAVEKIGCDNNSKPNMNENTIIFQENFHSICRSPNDIILFKPEKAEFITTNLVSTAKTLEDTKFKILDSTPIASTSSTPMKVREICDAVNVKHTKRIQILSDLTFPPNKKVKVIFPCPIKKSTTRKFFCRSCKLYYPFDLQKMISCSICKTWSCLSCSLQLSSHQTYICKNCNQPTKT